MGRNIYKRTAAIEKVAVWRIKFTTQQAYAFWELFSARPGPFGERMDSLISRTDFFLAAMKGRLLIRKGLTDMVMDIHQLIDIYVWDGGMYKTPQTSPYVNLRGQMLHGTKILQAVHHKVLKNGKPDCTEIEWIERMLNLVVEE